MPWRAGASPSSRDNATSPTPEAPTAESIKKLDQIVQVRMVPPVVYTYAPAQDNDR